MRANLVAFQSLLQKFRDPAAQSSLIASSLPGVAPLARVKRVASVPKRSIQSSGSTTFPLDLDIFLPNWSRTRPCRTMVWNGTASAGDLPRLAYRPNIIIRATQKKRMSEAEINTLVGEKARRARGSSGQPSVEDGHSAGGNPGARPPPASV